jgi:hypothetical protein
MCFEHKEGARDRHQNYDLEDDDYDGDELIGSV